MQMIIEPSGAIRCVYSEAISLACLGQVRITRGSRVEPLTDGRWMADLAPVSGPKLGPFALRSEALAAEQQWLEALWLTPGAPR